MISRFANFFTPKDKVFAPLFKRAGDNVLCSSEMLLRIVTEKKKTNRLSLIQEMDELESTNDVVTHDIIQALSGTFITPFDREDIYRMATLLDDVIDLINVASKKIRIYKVDPNKDAYVTQLASLIHQSCAYVADIMKDIQLIRQKTILSRVIDVHSLENQADALFDEAIEKLFVNEKDAIVITKKKEIYKDLETTTDRCEDVMNVIESIHIKYS